VCRRQGPHGHFQLVRSHVTGRRIDEIARQEDAVGDAADTARIGAGRHRKAQCLAWLLAVSGEDIAAENQGYGREFRLGMRRGKVPVALRQGSRQRTDGQRALAFADAEQSAGKCAVCAGHGERPAGFAGKAVGGRPGDRGRRKPQGLQAIPRDQMDGQGSV
jgi:hypothetical protein